MACELTKGRSLDCKSSTGGVKAVYFAQLEDVTLTESSGAITDLEFATGAPTTLFKYNLPRGTGNYTETITGSAENGTVFYEPSVTIMLHGVSAADVKRNKTISTKQVSSFRTVKCYTY